MAPKKYMGSPSKQSKGGKALRELPVEAVLDYGADVSGLVKSQWQRYSCSKSKLIWTQLL